MPVPIPSGSGSGGGGNVSGVGIAPFLAYWTGAHALSATGAAGTPSVGWDDGAHQLVLRDGAGAITGTVSPIDGTFLAGDGSFALPSIAFRNANGVGFRLSSPTALDVCGGGGPSYVTFDPGAVEFRTLVSLDAPPQDAQGFTLLELAGNTGGGGGPRSIRIVSGPVPTVDATPTYLVGPFAASPNLSAGAHLVITARETITGSCVIFHADISLTAWAAGITAVLGVVQRHSLAGGAAELDPGVGFQLVPGPGVNDFGVQVTGDPVRSLTWTASLFETTNFS